MAPEDEKVEKLVDDYLERRVDRRQFLQRSAALGLTLSAASALLAACGGDEEARRRRPPSRHPPSPHRPSTEPPGGRAGRHGAGRDRRPQRQAGRSGSASPIDIINLDPAFYPGSVRRDQSTDGDLRGASLRASRGRSTREQLAETFEPSEDGLRWDFTLKKGIQFHGDYGEVTAEDVKFSFERIAGLTKPKLESPYPATGPR